MRKIWVAKLGLDTIVVRRGWLLMLGGWLLLAGCGNRPASSSEPPSDISAPLESPVSPSASNQARASQLDFAPPDVDEAEIFESYRDLVQSADLVVVGAAIDLTRGPLEGSDEVQIATARISVAVKEVLQAPQGWKLQTEVEVAAVVGYQSDYAPQERALRESLPDGDAIWILRSIGEYYPGVYRLVTLASLIEPAADGHARPAWYRATAERAHNGELGRDPQAIANPIERLALELVGLTFEQAVDVARDPADEASTSAQ